MVIWDRKHLPPELAVGEIPGTIYGLSTKGWIDQELFHLWCTQHFLRYAPIVRPLLLLMDGHSSHYSPSTIKTAAKEKVILFTLPPNTTHLTQPLDKANLDHSKSNGGKLAIVILLNILELESLSTTFPLCLVGLGYWQ